MDVRSQAGGFPYVILYWGGPKFFCLGWGGGGVLALLGGNSPASLTITLVVLLGEITFQNTTCKTLRHKTLPLSLRAT